MALVLAASLAAVAPAAAQTRRPAAGAPRVYTATLPVEKMRNKQAVVTTSLGDIVIELLPDAAPDHVGYLMKLAEERRLRRHHLPSRHPARPDPGRRSAVEGPGEEGAVRDRRPRRAEVPRQRSASTCAARSPRCCGRASRTAPARSSSSASRDQPTLDGQFTVFGRVVEGLEIAQQISEMPADANGLITDRVEITTVRIRDTPPPEPTPFETETAAQLAGYRAVLETTMGEITVEFFPDRAPGHVRNFLRLSKLGVFDGTAFHRVVPGFVVQTGALTSRKAPLTQKQRPFVRQPAAGVQPDAARGGHPVDGPRRRSGERPDVVLHLPGQGVVARQQVHRCSAASSTACRSSRPWPRSR